MEEKIKQFFKEEFKLTKTTLLDAIVLITIYELIGLLFK